MQMNKYRSNTHTLAAINGLDPIHGLNYKLQTIKSRYHLCSIKIKKNVGILIINLISGGKGKTQSFQLRFIIDLNENT